MDGPYPVTVVEELYDRSRSLPDDSPFIEVRSGLEFLAQEVGRAAGGAAVLGADQASASVGTQVRYVDAACARLGL